jgi:hypothetical protein
MMKRNAIIRTAVATAVLTVLGAAATAGTLAGTRNVAQEAFGSAVSSTTTINGPVAGISYTFATSGGIVINPGGAVYLTVTPTNGKFSTTAVATANLAVSVPTTAGGRLTSTSTVAFGSAGEIIVKLANDGTDNAVLGVGASVSIGGTTTNNLTLSTGATALTVIDAMGLASGTPVSASGQVGTASGTGNLEAASTAVNVITSSQAVTSAAQIASGFAANAETAKIDLTSTPTAGTRIVDSNNTNYAYNTLGSVTFSDASTAAQYLAATTAVVVTNATVYTGGTSFDISLVSGAFTAGTTFSLNSDATCLPASALAGSTQTPTTVAATTTLVTLANTTQPTTSAFYICATYPSTAAITPYQPKITGKLVKASTAYLDKAVASTNMYNLVNNGAVVDVNTYIPATDGGIFSSFMRIVNAGQVAAPITVALVNPVTGNATTLGNLPSLAAGAVITYTSAQLEAATTAVTFVAGDPGTSTQRPRLRFTAPTNSLKVQSFLYNSSTNAFVEVSGVSTGQ